MPDPARKHKIIIDGHIYDQAGREYRAIITVNEAKLDAVMGAAIERHDKKKVFAGGAFVVEAVPLNNTPSKESNNDI